MIKKTIILNIYLYISIYNYTHLYRNCSLSVQETLFKIGKVVLQTLPQLESISFSMPNIHIFEYPKFKVLGVPGNETFIAYTDPSGSINGRVVRSQQKAKL